MTTIGITGGIGSGKSYVCKWLNQHYGIPVYDTDTEAKRLMTASPAIRQGLIQLLGEDVYLPDGPLNKPRLAGYLFQSDDNAQRINAIVHPAVADDFLAWVERHKRAELTPTERSLPTEEPQTTEGRRPTEGQGTPPLLIMESAILFESGFDRLVDSTICVTAPTELCIQRAMQRDSASRQAIESRIERQMPDHERRALAHYTIINDGHDIEPEINKILKRLC